MALDTIPQFRDEIQACDSTVRKWITEGVIPVYRVGRFIRIDRQAALAALRDYNSKQGSKRRPKKNHVTANKEAVA